MGYYRNRGIKAKAPKINKQDKEKLLARIKRVTDNCLDELNQRETDFILDIPGKVERFGNLTSGQLNWFESIESKSDSSTKEERETWVKKFNEEFREKALICAQYYANLGRYWDKPAAALLANPQTHVWSKTTYKKICENQYSAKILRNHFAAPKYPVKTLVQFRKVKDVERKLHNTYALVVVANAGAPTSPCNGAKKYRVLPFGSSTPILTEERYIKKAKGIAK